MLVDAYISYDIKYIYSRVKIILFSHFDQATAPSHGWTLIPKRPLKVNGKTIVPDGTLRDDHYLSRVSC